MKTTAILGYPGAGKSWAVYNFGKTFLDGYGVSPDDPAAVRKRVGLVDYHDFGKTVIMGIYDGTKFQGTDRLSMAVSVDFDRFFQHVVREGANWVIAEGDRINNSVFFQAALKYGTLERIKCMPETYEKLRKQREQREHTFTQSFLKTVASKVDKHNFDQTLTSDQILTYLNEQ